MSEVPKLRSSRRRFLVQVGLTMVATVSAACAPTAPAAPGGASKPAAATAPVGATPAPGATAKPTAVPEVKPVRGGKLTISLSRDANSLNNYDPGAGAVATHYASGYYQQLFRQFILPTGETEPRPELAESWEQVNPTTIVFKLRQGVQFHDGSEFDANVAQWNYERLIDPQRAGSASIRLLIKETRVLDKYTFQITMPGPNSLWFAAWASSQPAGPTAPMYSPAYVEKVGEAELAKKPMGTGPFKFVEWVPNDHLTMTRFENFWDKDSFGTQLPYLDEIVWKPIEDPTAGFNALRTGTTDMIVQILPTDVQTARNDPKLKISDDPGGYQYIDLQVKEGVFTDKRLRQAFNWAIDREIIHRSVYLGTGGVPTTRLPATHWATDPKEPYYTYDPDKAKALMKEAGVSNFKIIMPFSNAGVAPRLAQIVQAQVKDLGMEVELQPMAAAGIVTRQGNMTDWNAGMQDFSGTLPRSQPDITTLGNLSTVGGAHRGIYAAGVEAVPLLDEARQTFDRTKQRQLYLQAWTILFDGSGFVNLHRNVNPVAMRKDLMGYLQPASPYDQYPHLLWLQK